MAISPSLTESLVAIAAIMSPADDPWWIIASAAVALHGADPGRVSDIDVLLSIADATRLLPAIGIALAGGTPHPTFRSGIFGTWTGTALPVEFMAGFHRWSGAIWLPVQPTTRQSVAVDGVTVFVPARAELLDMLIAFGRPKDLERARRLAALPERPSR